MVWSSLSLSLPLSLFLCQVFPFKFHAAWRGPEDWQNDGAVCQTVLRLQSGRLLQSRSVSLHRTYLAILKSATHSNLPWEWASMQCSHWVLLELGLVESYFTKCLEFFLQALLWTTPGSTVVGTTVIHFQPYFPSLVCIWFRKHGCLSTLSWWKYFLLIALKSTLSLAQSLYGVLSFSSCL